MTYAIDALWLVKTVYVYPVTYAIGALQEICRTKKVKKEGPNQDRLFYICPHPRESACDFFEWNPDEDPLEPGCVCLFSMPPSYRYTVRKTGETFTSKETDS